jgi:hypothetical protein
MVVDASFAREGIHARFCVVRDTFLLRNATGLIRETSFGPLHQDHPMIRPPRK